MRSRPLHKVAEDPSRLALFTWHCRSGGELAPDPAKSQTAVHLATGAVASAAIGRGACLFVARHVTASSLARSLRALAEQLDQSTLLP